MLKNKLKSPNPKYDFGILPSLNRIRESLAGMETPGEVRQLLDHIEGIVRSRHKERQRELVDRKIPGFSFDSAAGEFMVNFPYEPM